MDDVAAGRFMEEPGFDQTGRESTVSIAERSTRHFTRDEAVCGVQVTPRDSAHMESDGRVAGANHLQVDAVPIVEPGPTHPPHLLPRMWRSYVSIRGSYSSPRIPKVDATALCAVSSWGSPTLPSGSSGRSSG